eukprot:COSAG01_NODE_1399_length_10465_cov_3.558267_13_plen_84_part_00
MIGKVGSKFWRALILAERGELVLPLSNRQRRIQWRSQRIDSRACLQPYGCHTVLTQHQSTIARNCIPGCQYPYNNLHSARNVP